MAREHDGRTDGGQAHEIRCPVCGEPTARCVWESGTWTYEPCGHTRPSSTPAGVTR